MTEREKVIKAIEICYSEKHNCTECELFYVEDCNDKLMRDVLELLKEQEPKQVIGIADSIEGMEVGYCPSCDRAIVNKKIDETKFCKFCGQAVKWDGGI